MSSNYPPGVTGNEYQIAGPDGEREIDDRCPKCGKSEMIEEFYGGESRGYCLNCNYVGEWEFVDDEDD